FIHQRHCPWRSARMRGLQFIDFALKFPHLLGGGDIEKSMEICGRQIGRSVGSEQELSDGFFRWIGQGRRCYWALVFGLRSLIGVRGGLCELVLPMLFNRFDYVPIS